MVDLQDTGVKTSRPLNKSWVYPFSMRHKLCNILQACDLCYILSPATSDAMIHYIKLLRPKDWAKNSFLFIPLFFAGDFFNLQKILMLLVAFFAFSFTASSIYIINDYRDIEDDKKHPKKSKRPLASGKVKKQTAIVICIILLLAGMLLAWLIDPTLEVLFVLGIYFCMNLAYSLGLKNISILDIIILAAGFVLRIKVGSLVPNPDIDLSEWLNIMVFLLAIFMAIAKRRDDVILKLNTGEDMRKSIKGYNLDFLNTMLGLFGAIIIVAYIMYTMWPDTYFKFATHRLYYTSVFVIAGVLRYLQITFVKNEAGSPTDLLYKDRFIQATLGLWVASFYVILYLRNVTIFG